jgi:hypothetical protein
VRRRTIRAYGRGGPGLTLWQSRDELARSRKRTVWVAAGLALLALLWLAAFADPTPEPDGDSDVATGVVILEIFTLAPLGVALWRIRRLTLLLRRVDSVSEEDLEATARAVRDREEAVWRVGRLVDGLEPGPIRDAASDALAAGHAANESRRRLHHRVSQLEHLRAVTKGAAARRRLDQARTACERDLAELDEQVEAMAGSVADLVDAATTPAADAEMARVRDATERVAALAQAMRELGAVS